MQNKSCVATADKLPRSLRSVRPAPPRHHSNVVPKNMKTLYLTLAIIMLIGTPAHANRGQLIKGVLVALGVGTAAASDEKVDQVNKRFEERKDDLRAAGYAPHVSAQFEFSLNLNSSADHVYWADFFGAPDVAFIVEGIGKSEVLVPQVHSGYKGGGLHHVIYGDQAPEDGVVAIHVFDDDDDLNNLFYALKPTDIEVGIPVYGTEVGIRATLPQGREKIFSPDYIGSIVVQAPKGNNRWKGEGKVLDRHGRDIGSFSIAQIPIVSDDEIDGVESSSTLFTFIKWAAIIGAALVGISWIRGLFKASEPTT